MAIESRYLIDWLAFTVLGDADPRLVIKSLDMDQFGFQQMNSGRYGYPAGYTVDGLINVLYSPYREDMGVHVEMTGQGIRRFETLLDTIDSSWFDFLELLDKDDNVRFSRIDIAFDDFVGDIGFDKIIGKINSGNHVGKFRSFKVISGRDSAGAHQGTTIYMGSSKSDSMLRVYEKNFERQLKGYEVLSDVWNRWELVLKHDKAVKFVKEFLEYKGDVGVVFRGVLSDLIRFVEPSNDSNKSRWPTSPWWSKFLENCEGISLSKGEYQPSLAKTIDWIDSSALSSLKALYDVAAKEDLDFSDILFKQEFRRKKFEKANKLVKEFEGLSKEEKKKIIGSLKNIGIEKRYR